MPHNFGMAFQKFIERLSLRVEFAAARKWLREHPVLRPSQPTVGVMLSKPAQTPAVAERDQWTEVLRCPRCAATGTAALSQANPASEAFLDGTDRNIRLERAPPGFTFTENDCGCEFYCAECGVVAHHR